jgi:hypothetical protein
MLNREVGFALNNGHGQPSLSGPESAISRCEQSQRPPEPPAARRTGSRSGHQLLKNLSNLSRVVLTTTRRSSAGGFDE